MFFGGSRDDREGANPAALLLMMILGPVAAGLIQAAISRSREFAADAGGAAIAGSPHGLVNALRKIEAVARRVPLEANPATAHMFIIKPFSAGGMMALFSTHPPTEQRVAALLGRSLIGSSSPFLSRTERLRVSLDNAGPSARDHASRPEPQPERRQPLVRTARLDVTQWP